MTSAIDAGLERSPAPSGGPPHPVARLLGWTGLVAATRLAIAAPFLVSGVGKLLDITAATAETAGLGLPAPASTAGLVIATQLAGSGLFLTRRWCWLGAGLLSGFTIVATLIAHPFWNLPSADRARQAMTFLEHVAIVGGLGAAAILAHRAPIR